MNARTLVLPIALLIGVSAAQCPPGAPAEQSPQEQQKVEQDRLSRLEREARALVRTDGCTALDQCRAAPVGARPCGGPRDYVVYCARTTDSAALYRKLDELKQAEIEFNRKSGLMSTCEFRVPPALGIEGGQCKSVPIHEEIP